jgi:ABC-type multidrug transport system fused ATPase/permease subunit
MRGLIIALLVCSLAAGLAEAGILAILAEAALMLAGGKRRLAFALGPVHLHASLSMLLGVGVGLALVRLVLGIAVAYVPARISERTQASMRTDLFAAFSRASWSVQSSDREGTFQELITNHVGQAVGVVWSTAVLITSLLTLLVLLVSAVAVSPVAAAGIIVVVGGLSLGLRPLAAVAQRRARALSDGWLEFAGGVNEAVRMAEEAHIFGVEDRQRDRLQGLIAVLRRSILHTTWLGNLIPNVYQGVVYLLLVLALAALDGLNGGHVGSLGVVVLMLIRSGAYGQQVQSAMQGVRQAQPYLERVAGAERRYRESTPPQGTLALARVSQLTFESVSFSYDESQPPVLNSLDFTVEGGETIGIVGPSGAGKSTLVQVLLGLRPASSGQYLVSGIPAGEIRRADWHRAFAYVSQEPRLLHASVADNIRFFRDLPDEAVWRAARWAGIHDEVMGWSAGYETVVGPRADAVSGGQQQRICLARALAADPEVLVLDEPTSALDPLTEQVIQESLVRLKDRLTLFIVAHRMSTLDICDRVMVVADGRLQAFAAIDDLMSQNDYYRAAIAASTSAASRPPAAAPVERAES